MVALSVVLFINRSRKININVLYLTAVFIGLGLVTTLYWVQPKLVGLLTYFIFSMWTINILAKSEIEAVVRILSVLIAIILACAVIGALYAYFGGMPLLDFANPDGRLNQLYLTTLTNAQTDNFIRPAGIFDEPGALSFVTCLIAAMRSATGADRKGTWWLLGLGFITMSVAHLLYVICHALQEWKGAGIKKIPLPIVVAMASLIFIGISLPPIKELFHALFISRFYDGQLGDDRLGMFGNAINYLSLQAFLFGVDSDCAAGLVSCTSKGYEYFGDNPLTLLVKWGLLISLPYYLVMGCLLIRFFRKFDFIILGIFLLLLQRPYVMSYGYSMLVMLAAFVLFYGEALHPHGVRLMKFSPVRADNE